MYKIFQVFGDISWLGNHVGDRLGLVKQLLPVRCQSIAPLLHQVRLELVIRVRQGRARIKTEETSLD